MTIPRQQHQPRPATLPAVPATSAAPSARSNVALTAAPVVKPSTTPRLFGLLRALSIVLTLLFAVITAVAGYQAQALSDASSRDAAQFARVSQIRGHLMRAHSLAHDNFVVAAAPAERRKAYTDELGAASALVVEAGAANSSDLRALQDVTRDMLTYTTDVQAAMTARQTAAPGVVADVHTPGADSLGSASSTLLDKVDPKLAQLSDTVHERLVGHARGVPVWWIVVPGVLSLTALVATAIIMALRTHRVLNLQVTAATALVLAAVVIAVTAFAGADATTRQAMDSSHQATGAAARAQIAGGKAKFAEAQRLLGDGSAQTGSRFDSAVDEVDSLLPATTPGQRTKLTSTWTAYRDAAATAATIQRGADGREHAVEIATSNAPVSSSSTFTAFATAASDAVSDAAQQTTQALSGATFGLRTACVGVALLALGASILSSWGISRRLAEYR